MPNDFCNADGVQSLAEQIRGYMAKHGLKRPAMAAHVGISVHTLKGIITEERNTRGLNRARIIEALAKPPPRKPDPPHADVVRQYWGRESSEAIGKRVNVSGARIRAIALAIGLTNGEGITPDERHLASINAGEFN